MVTFDHRDPGTTEDAWRAAGLLDRLPPLDLPDGAPHLVVLAAHPDDESLGAGGLLARLTYRGTPVTVVVATDGEASHPDSPTLSPARLAGLRRRELVDAIDVAAPGAAVVFLGLPDGGLREHRPTLHRRLSAILGPVTEDERGPGEGGPVLLCAPWRGDGHRDHRIAGEVAAAVAGERGARLLEYPIWWWHWGNPDDRTATEDMRALTLTPQERTAKRFALAAHRSQVEPLSPDPRDAATVGPEMLRHADRAVEVFVEAPCPSPAPAAPSLATGSGSAAGRGPGSGSATSESLPAGFFDAFYRGRPDPWGFETRWYEERKRAVTLASLPRARFRAGLEVGCSTGVLTADLATRCDRLVGVDVAAAALAAARDRLGDEVELLRLQTPAEWPEGLFDLVVLSEVGYYYGASDLETAISRAVGSLTADGVLVACHWRHPVPEYPLRGDDVHAALAARAEIVRLVHHLEEDFVLEVFVRPPGRSVAAEAGLA
ncbi:methyltransferase domain-containing protein [Oerskovia turbata]|uniref:Methyltransferase domain-containing protein n=1 Tax=Oerskovia turbata TaxID=1713 RepID=A0A4Q1KP11_9CELL|nr:methyltransferase domain-containing protein [Oerskovia turbata]RXR31637.1 methyltransferase domain-containing protein [Oerskovia turbata]